MTRVLDVETVLTFIMPGVEDGFSWVLISRHLISGYLLATSSALKQPLPCTIIRVDASTRPGPPPRGASASASARTFLLPAPGNHASSSFLTLLTPSFRVIDIYFELLTLLTFHNREGFDRPQVIFISSLISLLELRTYTIRTLALFHPRSFRHKAITSGHAFIRDSPHLIVAQVILCWMSWHNKM
jgi:hypothetical protein